MGIKERLQRAAWWIGRPFCEIGDLELDRRRVALAEEVRLLHQFQADYHRKIEEQQVILGQMQVHQAECDQERAEMRDRLNAMNEDRLALFRLLTQEPTEAPPLQLLSGSE